MESKEKVHQMTRDVFKAAKWLWDHSKFKKRSTEPVENDKKPEENLLSKCVVPYRKVSTEPLPTIDESHNSFDEIVKGPEGIVKYRLKSESSKEIFRMQCLSREYEIGCIEGKFVPEVKVKLNDVITYWYRCVSEEDSYFWLRIFRTDNGHYFQQVIHSDGHTTFRIISKERVQELVEKCEAPDGDDDVKWIWRKDATYGHFSVIRDGTEIDADTELSDIHVDSALNHEEIVGCSVVDEALYDGIIEVY